MEQCIRNLEICRAYVSLSLIISSAGLSFQSNPRIISSCWRQYFGLPSAPRRRPSWPHLPSPHLLVSCTRCCTAAVTVRLCTGHQLSPETCRCLVYSDIIGDRRHTCWCATHAQTATPRGRATTRTRASCCCRSDSALQLLVHVHVRMHAATRLASTCVRSRSAAARPPAPGARAA